MRQLWIHAHVFKSGLVQTNYLLIINGCDLWLMADVCQSPHVSVCISEGFEVMAGMSNLYYPLTDLSLPSMKCFWSNVNHVIFVYAGYPVEITSMYPKVAKILKFKMTIAAQWQRVQ